MKKHYYKTLLLSSCIALVQMVSAADFSFSPARTYTVESGCLAASMTKVSINNTSGSSANFSWNLITNTIPDATCWTISLCDNQGCYSVIPATSTLAPLTYTINPNVFTFDVNSNGNTGSGLVQLEVVDVNDPNNKDTITFHVNGCSSGNICPTLVPYFSIENVLSVYPNPAKEFINIKVNDAGLALDNPVGVYNILGEKIMNLHLNRSENNRINLNGLTTGLYFVRYENNKGQSVTKKFYKSGN